MYGWIWRHLPFGLPGKIIGSSLLALVVVAVLWFWGFPAVEPLLPFDDVQVGTDQQVDQVNQTPTGPASPASPAPSTVAPSTRSGSPSTGPGSPNPSTLPR
jgi:hypothetical protein